MSAKESRLVQSYCLSPYAAALTVLLTMSSPSQADPIGLGVWKVQYYCMVPNMGRLASDPNGNLYTGYEPDGRVRKIDIHRNVIEIGAPLSDPDGVVYDAVGGFSGAPGSVLVGAGNEVWAIHPDNSMARIFGPEHMGQGRNIQALDFDYLGRLLLVDGTGLLRASGGTVEMVAPTPWHWAYDLTVSDSGAIVVGGGWGMMYCDPEGQMTGVSWDPDYVTGLTIDSVGNLYVADVQSSQLLQITPGGQRTVIAVGFAVESPKFLEWGADDALYLGDFNASTIYRIVPEPATMILLGLGGVALIRRRSVGQFVAHHMHVDTPEPQNVVQGTAASRRRLNVIASLALSLLTTSAGAQPVGGWALVCEGIPGVGPEIPVEALVQNPATAWWEWSLPPSDYFDDGGNLLLRVELLRVAYSPLGEIDVEFSFLAGAYDVPMFLWSGETNIDGSLFETTFEVVLTNLTSSCAELNPTLGYHLSDKMYCYKALLYYDDPYAMLVQFASTHTQVHISEHATGSVTHPLAAIMSMHGFVLSAGDHVYGRSLQVPEPAPIVSTALCLMVARALSRKRA